MSEPAYERELEREINRETKSYLKKGLSIIEQLKLWALDERNVELKETDIERFLKEDTLKREGVS
jgi:hypothetical protein